MTCVKFFSNLGVINGFEIKGHSSKNSDDELGKIVCSAVSSAAYMTANTITEVIKASAKIKVDDALMVLRVDEPSGEVITVLKGFRLHIEQLAEQYSSNIKVYSEV
ncbi:MAG: ribosomal-processing cysteine protease Prp [Ruminococcaceae bacterium]|nr:ribosomal-processing cysteine protease Prp [Oscillospiraceae bacterium]